MEYCFRKTAAKSYLSFRGFALPVVVVVVVLVLVIGIGPCPPNGGGVTESEGVFTPLMRFAILPTVVGKFGELVCNEKHNEQR